MNLQNTKEEHADQHAKIHGTPYHTYMSLLNFTSR